MRYHRPGILIYSVIIFLAAAALAWPQFRHGDDNINQIPLAVDNDEITASATVNIAQPAVAPVTAVLAPVELIVSAASSSIVSSSESMPVELKPEAVKIKGASSSLINHIPFTSQAPLGEWSDERQQDACEEASVLMAMAWVKSKNNVVSQEEWRRQILDLVDFENEKYGEHRDVSLDDVVSWIFNDYFNYDGVMIKAAASPEDILSELERGHLVLIPANGQALKNPHFTSPGPERHMLLVTGYDYQTKEFVTNDPGTRYGGNYRYDSGVLFNAIRPYLTGNKLPFPSVLARKMIVVEK